MKADLIKWKPFCVVLDIQFNRRNGKAFFINSCRDVDLTILKVLQK